MVLGVYGIFIGVLILIEILSGKRIRFVLPITIFLLFAILMGASTDNPDTYIYENYIFGAKDFFYKDAGFGILILIFKKLNLGYYHLKMFVAIVGIILINHTLKKYLKDCKLFYVLYFIFPFFYDVIQVRNFLAMSIFVFSVPWLIEKNNKGIFKYIVAILIAATIQKTALIYLPIVFIRNLQNRKIMKIVLICIIVLLIVISFSKNLLNNLIILIQNNLALFLVGLDSKLEITTNLGWILSWLIQFSNFFLIRKSKKIIDNMKTDDESIKRYVNLVYNINIYMFIFLPLYILTPTFERIMRNILPLNYICYTYIFNKIYSLKSFSEIKIRNYYILFITFVLLFNILMYILRFAIINNTYFTEIVNPILTKNWILELLS